MYNQFMMKKSGLIVTDFPWESTKLPQPWKPDYRRVVVPFTEKEKLHARSGKSTHTLIVKKSKLMPFDAGYAAGLKRVKR